jgi:folate-binding protein YgfZ
MQTDARLVALPAYAFLQVDGARAVEFLQGQLSCDMRAANPARTIGGAWCSIKGRVLAHFLVRVRTAEQVLMRLHADLAQDTCTALARYAALSRVRITVATPPMSCLGVYGAGAREAVRALCGQLAEEPLASAPCQDDVLVVQRDGAGNLFELWCPAPAAAAGIRTALAAAGAGDESAWRAALARARLAEVQYATRDRFLPQMLAYDLDGTVSFRKGCYTGQEVVARAHYRGAVKRHLQHLRAVGAGPIPAPGDDVLDGERVAGTVVEAGRSASGAIELLAVVADEESAPAAALRTRGGHELVRAN